MSKLFELGGVPPRLKGQRCADCGRVSFPPNPYGCEVCGASGSVVEEQLLSGEGRLLAFVTTNHANQRDTPVPFTIASIALEDGPVIRALMTVPTDAGLNVNDPVEAVIVIRETSHDDERQELRFQTVEAS